MSSAKHNIKQSIDLVLQTVCGDRSMNPSFGSELSHCVFRNLDPSLEAEIVGKVQTSLLNFEPRIKVEQVTIIANQGQDNIVTIDIGIAYQIKMTNSRDNHIYPFYLNEATNLQTKQG
jgi:phage baseplate assembly protein W